MKSLDIRAQLRDYQKKGIQWFQMLHHYGFGGILADDMGLGKTEFAIIDNLKETRKDKTTIITAHRLSAVVHADLILVMQNGRIIERGTHEDLLALDGWYAQTYQSQQLEMKGEEDAQ